MKANNVRMIKEFDSYGTHYRLLSVDQTWSSISPVCRSFIVEKADRDALGEAKWEAVTKVESGWMLGFLRSLYES